MALIRTGGGAKESYKEYANSNFQYGATNVNFYSKLIGGATECFTIQGDAGIRKIDCAVACDAYLITDKTTTDQPQLQHFNVGDNVYTYDATGGVMQWCNIMVLK